MEKNKVNEEKVYKWKTISLNSNELFVNNYINYDHKIVINNL